MALALPAPPETANITALAAWKQDRLTGLTTTAVPLTAQVDVKGGICLVWKNGTLLDPNAVTIDGATLTLASALIAGDIVVVFYHSRG